MKDSLILCTKDRCKDIKITFESILVQTHVPNEIIVVDSSKDEKTKKYLYSLKLDNLIYINSKPGLTYQRNVGIKQASGDVLHFIDDDVNLDKNYFQVILDTFNKSDDIGGVGGILTNRLGENKLRHIIDNIFMLTRVDGDGIIQKSGFPAFQWRNQKHMNKVFHITEILCGIASYRKGVFENIFFDEKLDGYGLMEDIDFSFRVSKKYILIYNSNANVYHRATENSRINYNKLYFMYVRNTFYLYNKNIKKISPVYPFFLWGQIGILFYAIFYSIKDKSFDSIIGYFKGWLNIIKKDYENSK